MLRTRAQGDDRNGGFCACLLQTNAYLTPPNAQVKNHAPLFKLLMKIDDLSRQARDDDRGNLCNKTLSGGRFVDNTQGFTAHTDSQDVLIIQLEVRKRTALFPSHQY
jgi:hypothetical protein